MMRGAVIFVGVLFSMACSWAALIFGSQVQLGALLPGAIVNSSELYPAPRPGLAQQGAAVYRANGCFYCHSQQVRQGGITFGAVITDPGTNTIAVLDELVKLDQVAGLTPNHNKRAHAVATLTNLPIVLVAGVGPDEARKAMNPFNATGAKTELTFKNLGADIAAGLGPRGSVARDYLFDNPPLPGSIRIGPDLANIGTRAPERFAGAWNLSAAARTNDLQQAAERTAWHLHHLYNPRVKNKSSTMPGYPFLFEARPMKAGAIGSPDALRLTGEFAPAAGWEIVPTGEARALVAYLLSLRHAASLAERAVPRPPTLPAPSTNAPAAKP
jgi:cytochrome c oxidase cbb3-type subunit 2